MNKVVISQRIDLIEGYNEQRDSLDAKWAKLFAILNTALFPIPNEVTTSKFFLETINPNAIVLSGGPSSVEYGGKFQERDLTDKLLIEYAIKNNIPLMGVCRGMQSIISYFNGKLVKVDNHIAKMHKITGTINKNVNSFHSLGVLDLPPELTALSYASDNTIESIEHKTYKIYGIMWHPERELNFDNEDLKLLKEKLELKL